MLLVLTFLSNRLFVPMNGTSAPFISLTIASLLLVRGVVDRVFRSLDAPLFPAATPLGLFWFAGFLYSFARSELRSMLDLSSPGPSVLAGWPVYLTLLVVVPVVVGVGACVDAVVRWRASRRGLAWCGLGVALVAVGSLGVLVCASFLRAGTRPSVDQYVGEMALAGDLRHLEGTWPGQSVGHPPPAREHRESVGTFIVVRACDERGDCRLGLLDQSGARRTGADISVPAPVVRWSAGLRLFFDKRSGAVLVVPVAVDPPMFGLRTPVPDAGAREGEYDKRFWFHRSGSGYRPFDFGTREIARRASPPREWIASGAAGFMLACVALLRRRFVGRRARALAGVDPDAEAEAWRIDGEIAILACLCGAPLLASAFAGLIM